MNDHKTVVQTTTAPEAIGPYSQAIKSGNTVYLSMQIALDPASGKLAGADAAAQAERVLKNVEAILVATGSAMARVVRTTVYLADMADFDAVNEIYKSFFPFEPPARTMIQVGALPKGARVGIDAIATCHAEESQFGPSRF